MTPECRILFWGLAAVLLISTGGAAAARSLGFEF